MDEIGLSTIKNLLLWITILFFDPHFLDIFSKNSAIPFISCISVVDNLINIQRFLFKNLVFVVDNSERKTQLWIRFAYISLKNHNFYPFYPQTFVLFIFFQKVIHFNDMQNKCIITKTERIFLFFKEKSPVKITQKPT